MSRLTKQWGKDNANCVATELDYLCLVGLEEHEFLAFDKIVRKLAYYEDLEESGKLFELPCKLKDAVWQIVKCSDGVNRIFEMKVCSLCKYGSIYNSKEPSLWNVYLEDKDGFGYSYATFYDFGKSVFLTRDEAELKLKEMK